MFTHQDILSLVIVFIILMTRLHVRSRDKILRRNYTLVTVLGLSERLKSLTVQKSHPLRIFAFDN